MIDLDAIRSNYHHLRSHLPEECVFHAVLKSDAYGHGIIEASNALIDAGCPHFAVGDLLEAIAPSKLIKIAKEAISKPHLRLEGLYAQSRDPVSARGGFEKIKAIYERMQSEGIAPRRLHFANSTTFLSHPDTVAGGVRLGMLIYGVLPPEQSSGDSPIPVKPAMRLHSEIVQLRDLPEGSKIGYRAEQKTSRDSVIGTIPIGYAHGLDRRLSGSGFVLVRGRQAPFIGAISMNDSTIDVTDIPDVRVGDDAVIVGGQNSQRISIPLPETGIQRRLSGNALL